MMTEPITRITDILTESAIPHLRVLLLCAKQVTNCPEMKERLTSLDRFMLGQCSLTQAINERYDTQVNDINLTSPLFFAFVNAAIHYIQQQKTPAEPLVAYLNYLLKKTSMQKEHIMEQTGFTRNIASITLACAKQLAQQAEIKAQEINVPMTIAVLDASCNLVLHQRMEDALQTSIHVALNKAYSAVSFKVPTYQLASLMQPGAELYGIQHTDPRLICFGGGFPIWLNNKLVGGLGVAGGTVAEDMSVAQFALKQVFGVA